MRIARPAALALSSLSLVAAACGEEATAVAKAPIVMQEPVAEQPIAAVEAQPVVASEPRVATAEPEREHPRSLLEQEALYHDDDTDWLAEGRRLLDEKRPGEAVDALRKALFDRPDGETFALLGTSYVAAGQPERGIACLEESLVLDDTSSEVRARVARASLAAGDAERAARHATVLAKVRAEDASAHYLLAKSYMQLSMWNEAIESFTRSLEIEPSSSYAHNNLGYSALMIGRDELALEHLEAVLHLEPVTAYMMNNLGLAYERTGAAADAYASFLRAEELKPGYVNAVVNQQRVVRGLSERERALALEILEELKEGPQPSGTMAAVASERDEAAGRE